MTAKVAIEAALLIWQSIPEEKKKEYWEKIKKKIPKKHWHKFGKRPDNPHPENPKQRKPPKEWMDYCMKKIVPKVKPEDAGAFCGNMWYNWLTPKTKAKYERKRRKRERKLKLKLR